MLPFEKDLTPTAQVAIHYRNKIISSLGCPNYKAYTHTVYWRRLLSAVTERSSTCFACGHKATTVHFMFYTYANLSGSSTDGVLPACVACIKACERNAEGYRVSPALQTEAFFLRYIARRDANKKPAHGRQEDPMLDTAAAKHSNVPKHSNVTPIRRGR